MVKCGQFRGFPGRSPLPVQGVVKTHAMLTSSICVYLRVPAFDAGRTKRYNSWVNAVGVPPFTDEVRSRRGAQGERWSIAPQGGTHVPPAFRTKVACVAARRHTRHCNDL